MSQPAAGAAQHGAAPTEHTLRLADGTEVFYRAWLPAGPARRTLLVFHRGHEHSGRLVDVVEALGLSAGDPALAVFAWDARGHGRSQGERGYAPSFGTMVADVEAFARHLVRAHGVALEDTVVLAHSVGAVTVSAWIHDYAPPLRGAVLVAPAFRVRLYVPFARQALGLLARLRGTRRTYVKSYVKSRMLTHDPAQAARYDADPLIARAIAVNVLLGMHAGATRLLADAGAIRVPTLILVAGSDRVVSVRAQRLFFDRLGAPLKRLRAFPGMYHDLLHERDREGVLEEVRAFVAGRFVQPPSRHALLDADQDGFTQREHDRLARPLPLLSPRRAAFAVQRVLLATVGRLSRGIRLGWSAGFDSGRMLDYVYENRAQGSLGIGRWMDRVFLGSVGWRGIRARKVHMEAVLRGTMERLRAGGRPVRILDIAAGAGRYVLETLAAARDPQASAVLRDYQRPNLEAGRALATSLGVANVVFVEGDAFDEHSLAATQPPPTIGIVSGLYELFPGNAQVSASLRGMARALVGGGYLIYTNQPWHPQLEMIARVLRNREGRPWVMRRRTQEEMDDLVQAAGFVKESMAIDEDGIFTVSLARRA